MESRKAPPVVRPPVVSPAASYGGPGTRRYPQPQHATAVWREGPLLVSMKNIYFPQRCIRCNAPTTTYAKLTLAWHPRLLCLMILMGLCPFVMRTLRISLFFPDRAIIREENQFLGIFSYTLLGEILVLGVLPYILLALCVQKRATVHVGVCPRHHAKWRKAILAGRILGIAGCLGSLVCLTVSRLGGIDLNALTLLMMLLLGAGLFVGSVLSVRELVRVHHIDAQYVYLKNVDRNYMLALPSSSPKEVAASKRIANELADMVIYDAEVVPSPAEEEPPASPPPPA